METVEVFLQHGTDPNLGNYNLINVAFIPYEENSLGVIKLLLSHGADINKHDNESNSLFVAIELGHDKVCKFLIQKIILMKAQGLFVIDVNFHASDTREKFFNVKRSVSVKWNC